MKMTTTVMTTNRLVSMFHFMLVLILCNVKGRIGTVAAMDALSHARHKLAVFNRDSPTYPLMLAKMDPFSKSQVIWSASKQMEGIEVNGNFAAVNAADNDDAPLDGYILVSFYSDGSDCSGPETLVWQRYGVCIASTSGGGATGTPNSFKYVLDSVAGNTYTFSQLQYSDTKCTTQTHSESSSYAIGLCNVGGKAVFNGVSALYEEQSNGVNIYSFNTQPLCTSANTSDVISAIWAKLNTCYIFGTGSILFTSDCTAASIWESSDCSGTPTYNGDYFEACDLNTDDILTDDSYSAIEFQQTTCIPKTKNGVKRGRGLGVQRQDTWQAVLLGLLVTAALLATAF